MSTAEARHTIFKDSFEKLKGHGLSPGAVTTLLNLGVSSHSNLVRLYGKLRGDKGRGITKVEALAVQLAGVLADDGYDLAEFKFDDDGRLIKAPKLIGHPKQKTPSGRQSRKTKK